MQNWRLSWNVSESYQLLQKFRHYVSWRLQNLADQGDSFPEYDVVFIANLSPMIRMRLKFPC